jgi:hypothetical protein
MRKSNFGDCRSKNTGYFRSCEKGHFKKDCPLNTTGGAGAQRNNFQQIRLAEARVYRLTLVDDDENDEANNDVVTGTISLFGTLACTLFDFGATHSFISTLYAKICHISTQPLDQDLLVQTPRGEKLTCNRIIMNYPIIIKDRILPANFVVLKTLGYNILLGMDWLARYYACINCREKEVIFHLPGVEEFRFHGTRV